MRTKYLFTLIIASAAAHALADTYTAGTGVAINSNVISIGQAVATTNSPQFTNVTLAGTGGAALRLNITGTHTGATTSYGILDQGIIGSGVTSDYNDFMSAVGTQAASFTLSNLRSFVAQGPAIGAGSTITNANGFVVTSTFTTATNNYGFRGQIASGTGRYNLYIDGTAQNYLAGNTGIGTLPGSSVRLATGGTATGATAMFAVYNSSTVASDVTSAFSVYTSAPLTQAASFTLGSLFHYRTAPQSFGAGSTVTNQYGYFADSGLTGATNNFGFYGDIAAGSGRWNLYINGTAQNFLAGNVGIGTSPAKKLDVLGSFRTQGGDFEIYDAGTPDVSAVRIFSAGGNLYLQNGSGNNILFRSKAGGLNMTIVDGGGVGIGTTTPGAYKLAVNGTIRAKEIIVDTGWSDYVFAEDYRLAPLSEVEAHIKEHKHLPGIPSAAKIEQEGVSLGEMQAKFLQKIEELTLHQIEQEKNINALRAELRELKGKGTQ